MVLAPKHASKSVTIHDYKLLELSNTSMIGSECYAEAMRIAPGQQSSRGAFTTKAKYGMMSLYSLGHLIFGPRSYYTETIGPGSNGSSPSICARAPLALS
jgi:hypothetical protein